MPRPAIKADTRQLDDLIKRFRVLKKDKAPPPEVQAKIDQIADATANKVFGYLPTGSRRYATGETRDRSKVRVESAKGLQGVTALTGRRSWPKGTRVVFHEYSKKSHRKHHKMVVTEKGAFTRSGGSYTMKPRKKSVMVWVDDNGKLHFSRGAVTHPGAMRRRPYAPFRKARDYARGRRKEIGKAFAKYVKKSIKKAKRG